MEKRHMYVHLFSFIVLSVTTVVSSQSPDFLIRTNQKETAAVNFNKSPDFGQENQKIQQLNDNSDDKSLRDKAATHVLKDSQLNLDRLIELTSETNLKSSEFTENADRDNQNGNIPSENQGFGNRDDEKKDVNKKFKEEVSKDTYGGKVEDDKEIIPVLRKKDFNSEESEKYFENANKVEPQNKNKDAKDFENLEKEENPGKITDIIKEFGKSDETKIHNEEEAKTEFENVRKQEAQNNVKDTTMFENVEETTFRDKTDKLKTEENVKEEESRKNINDRKYFVTNEAEESDYHENGRKEYENLRKEETKGTLEDRTDFESRENEESREQANSNEELAEKPEKESDKEKIDHTYTRESIGYPTISTVHMEQNSRQDISLKESQAPFEDEKETFGVSSVGGNNQISKADSQKVHNGSINQQLARVQTVNDTQNKSFEDAKVVIFTKQWNKNITQTSKMPSDTSGIQNTFPSTLTTPSIFKTPHRPKTYTMKSPQKPKKITKQMHKTVTANYMANTATTLLPAVSLKGDETMSNNNATTNTINQNTKNVKPDKISGNNNNNSGKKLSTNNAENILIEDGVTHKYTANDVHVLEYVQQGKDSAITPDDDTKSVFQYDNARDNVQLKEAADTAGNNDNPCKELSDPMKQYSSRALIAAAVGGVFVGAVTVLLLFHLKQKCRNYIRGDYRRVPMEYDFELNPRFKTS